MSCFDCNFTPIESIAPIAPKGQTPHNSPCIAKSSRVVPLKVKMSRLSTAKKIDELVKLQNAMFKLPNAS